MILWSSCALLFLLTTACNKESEKISMLSMHTWVVTSTSLRGTPGDEYKLYDNRLFIHTSGGAHVNDGEWSFDYSNSTEPGIRVTSDLGELFYEIKVSTTELQMTEVDNSGWGFVYPTITLTPKQ